MPTTQTKTDRDTRGTHAQTWDPVSGITVKRAVSSSRRTQAIFSSVFRAAISLLNVRMFFSSVLNLIVSWAKVPAEGPFGRVLTRQEFPPQSVSKSVDSSVSS